MPRPSYYATMVFPRQGSTIPLQRAATGKRAGCYYLVCFKNRLGYGISSCAAKHRLSDLEQRKIRPSHQQLPRAPRVLNEHIFQLGVTGSVASEVPKPVLLFGLAGGLPYIGASSTTVYLAYQAGLAATGQFSTIDSGVAIDQALSVQVTCGAVMLSFLGALHWGMEFAALGPAGLAPPRPRRRPAALRWGASGGPVTGILLLIPFLALALKYLKPYLFPALSALSRLLACLSMAYSVPQLFTANE
ncbi:hypothetical protein GGX14DRAFT_621175 [Mycena pura]|uniref:Uncharacterized protein n=1 Tax=Mycena pura TaxID=153505 RepID=A0AAD6VH88_9AGAR|nr:hypothetical protein GGX14DRAFT_621175 [Mycena pura]